MNILVTGGAGFIGSHTVVELVNAGHTPIIVDNFDNADKSAIKGIETILGQSVKVYETDCQNQSEIERIIKEESIDGIIHFAAHKAVGESVANPLKYYENNLVSTLVLLKAMKNTGVKSLVFSSSCTVYGEPDDIPVTEATPRKPATSSYGNTKAICEDIMRDTVASGDDLRLIALRYFNPVGAHPSAEIGELPNGVPNNLVPYITQTAAGVREKLTIFGNDYPTIDGTNIRDFIHVVDLAKAHVAAFELLAKQNAAYYDVFNVGTGEGYTVLQLVNAFEKANNLKLNYEIGPRRAGDVEKIYGNVDKAAKIMGWKTEKTIEDSMRDAWRWEKKMRGIR